MKRGSFLLPFGKRGNLHLPFVFPLNPFSTLTRRQRVLPKAARFIYNPHLPVRVPAVAAHHVDGRVQRQPRCPRVGGTLWQQVHGPMAHEVADDRPVCPPLAPREVIDADHGEVRNRRAGQGADQPQ